MPWEPMSHCLREKVQNTQLSAHQGSATVLSPDPQECTRGPGVGLPVAFFNFSLINLTCCFYNK